MRTSKPGPVDLATQPVPAGECGGPRQRHPPHTPCTRFRSRPGRGRRGIRRSRGQAGGPRRQTRAARPAAPRTSPSPSQARSARMGRPPPRSSDANSSRGGQKVRTSAPNRSISSTTHEVHAASLRDAKGVCVAPFPTCRGPLLVEGTPPPLAGAVSLSASDAFDWASSAAHAQPLHPAAVRERSTPSPLRVPMGSRTLRASLRPLLRPSADGPRDPTTALHPFESGGAHGAGYVRDVRAGDERDGAGRTMGRCVHGRGRSCRGGGQRRVRGSSTVCTGCKYKSTANTFHLRLLECGATRV